MDKNIIFYDGHCGLCHGWVLFVLKFDKREVFQFSPLQGDKIKEVLSDEIRAKLPDSIVLQTTDHLTLVKSAAVEEILRKLGGIFNIISKILNLFPATFKDFIYDKVAKVRKKIFGERVEVCPMMPDHLRKRFFN